MVSRRLTERQREELGAEGEGRLGCSEGVVRCHQHHQGEGSITHGRKLEVRVEGMT